MFVKHKLALILLLTVALSIICAAQAVAKPNGLERNEYIAYLQQHVNSEVMDRWRGDEVPLASIADIEKYLAVFDYWSQMAEEAKKHKLSEKELTLLDAFKAKVSEIQQQALPKMRWVLNGMDAAVFGKDAVAISIRGDNSQEAVFSGRKAVNGDGQSFFDDKLQTLLQRLRFSSAVYEVKNNEGSRTETLTLDNFSDGDLAIWNPTTGKYRHVK